MRGDAGVPVRLRFAKRGKVRWISHRDVARAFERALRVGRFPVAFTGGFAPRPKVSFGLALPTGYESEAEYLDLELAGPEAADVDLDGLGAGISAGLPEGIEVTGAAFLEPRAVSLQEAVTLAAYTVEAVPAPEVAVAHDGWGNGSSARSIPALADLVEAALASSELVVVRVRKGRQVVDDLRPAIRRLEVTGSTRLEMELATQPRGVRPGEVLAAMSGSGLVEGTVVRTHQWIERDGERHEPLDADTRSRAEARVR